MKAMPGPNRSFGATTLRTRHARVSGQRLRLEYVGKSGKLQRLTIQDGRLARLVPALPGSAGAASVSSISMPMARTGPSPRRM
jgi:hypothetical protein